MAISRGVALALGLALAQLPGLAQNQLKNLYWGDTHLHTTYSIDAYNWGNINVDPDTAYRFAKGLPVPHPSLGVRVQLKRPLDFLAISDHDISFGVVANYTTGLPELMTTERGREWYRRAQAGEQAAVAREIQAANKKGGKKGGPPPTTPFEPVDPPAARIAIWNKYVDTAEKHNQPGKFTALIGWEWTAMNNGGNLHRVVFTAANAATAKKFYPYGTADSTRPEDLWKWLEQTSARIGADFISIPHNSNLSKGLMFDMVDSDGRPISAEYARQRIRWEPVVEVLQIKGNSETRPELSPNDEFANFEIYNALLVGGLTTPNEGDYVRSALLRGLKIEGQTGANPYKLGFQGATDSHTGLSTADEDNFYGKSTLDSTPASGPKRGIAIWDAIGWDFAAEGITGVWATENTREGIAAAFKRKEVYASSGPRIAVRVFGGFGFKAADARARDLAQVGYGKGVPMGGDLTAAPQGKAPSLLIHAVKDPIGANLDRVQVVKGWLDVSGATHEKVYDVAWSGNRKPGADGKLPPVGNSVDVTRATYENNIGDAQLATVWTDPNFNPRERSFYYVRVLQIPTPRHSLYDSVALGMDASKTGKPSSIQERAFSSPIWYTPR